MHEIIVGHYGWFGLTGDWKKHIDNLVNVGATHMRIFGQHSWPNGRGTYTPFALVKDINRINAFPWAKPGPGEEGRKDRYYLRNGLVWFRERRFPRGVYLPVYDLAFLEQTYFTRLRELFTYCKLKNMGIKFELEDWCSLKHEDPVDKYRHPYFVSPQAHSGATPGGLFGTALQKKMKKYWKRVVAVAQSTEVNISFSVMNEYYWKPPHVGGPISPDEERSKGAEWYENVQIMTDPGAYYDWFGSGGKWPYDIMDTVDRYWVHGIGNKTSYGNVKAKMLSDGFDISNPVYTPFIVISTDGFSTGTGIADFKGRKGISMAEVPFLTNLVKGKGYAGIEALIRYKQGHFNGTFEEFQEKYHGYDIIGAISKKLNNT